MLLQPGDALRRRPARPQPEVAVRHRPVPGRADARATATACWCRWRRTRSSIASPSRATARSRDDVLRQGGADARPRRSSRPRRRRPTGSASLELYARRGRFAATVEPKIIQLDQNRVDLVYEIQEGEAALVARINFVGNARLLRQPAEGGGRHARSRPGTASSPPPTSYDPERLAFDRELLRRYYLRNGYADVQVTNATAELAPDRTGFFVTYTIDEGARYRVGKVEVVSNLRNLDAASVRRAGRCRAEGDWYDGDAVERVAQALQDAANLRGYPFVDVQPRITRNREDRTGRPDLRGQRGAAGLRRAHRHRRQHPHPGPGHPPRVPPGRGRRLQRRAGPPLAASASATSATSPTCR